jgi:hypothetical protein
LEWNQYIPSVSGVCVCVLKKENGIQKSTLHVWTHVFTCFYWPQSLKHGPRLVVLKLFHLDGKRHGTVNQPNSWLILTIKGRKIMVNPPKKNVSGIHRQFNR